MLTPPIMRYGSEKELPQQVPLRAGPLELIYEQGDLRSIRVGDQEIVRRMYIAVRDRNWGTVPAVLSKVKIQSQENSFRISYEAAHRQGEIAFDWIATVYGNPDGTITFLMEGQALNSFWKNRIGFCILYPAGLAGRTAEITHSDHRRETAIFPVDLCSEQPVAPFEDLTRVAHEAAPGVLASLEMSGDFFEMEDQRNWTDASYKIYSTPLRLPYPVQVSAGTTFAQQVRLRLRSDRGEVLPASPAQQPASLPALTLEEGEPARPLPALGLGMASHAQPCTAAEIERLRPLRLSHLRVDLQPGAPACRETLERACAAARDLGCGLEAALLCSDQPAAELADFRQLLEELRPPILAWLCFPAKEYFQGGSATPQVVQAVRQALQDYPAPAQIPIYSGTNTDYIFMRRSMPPLDQIAGLSFSMCPQVHAFDNTSLMETLEGQAAAAASASRLGQGRPVRVSPVTLKMRFNPYATAAAPKPRPGELPPEVDPRQMALFGAAWTLGSIRALALAGAASLTYFETTGWRGVMETQSGPPEPRIFRSLPGSVFPLYHVLADMGDFAGGVITALRSSTPLQVTGVLLEKDGHKRLLAANLTPAPLTVQLPALPGFHHARSLNEKALPAALLSPRTFHEAWQPFPAETDTPLQHHLLPYEVLTLDSGSTSA